MDAQIVLNALLGLTFLITVVVVASLGYWLFGTRRVIRRRLSAIARPGPGGAGDFLQGTFSVHTGRSEGAVVAPRANWQDSRLGSRLVRSGLRTGSAMTVTLLAKILMAIVLPTVLMGPLILLDLVSTTSYFTMLWLVLLAFLGFLLPDIYLDMRARQRRIELETVFPDMLDLLVVCIEAGLSLDSAIQRVAREIRHVSNAMSDELQLVSLEMRAGKPRNDALRALAERTGLDDLGGMISILIQAENFGTSVGDALGNHALEMRTLRIQRAREKAAKLPVKLAFPIIFFIFPALFLVILGPALVRIFAGLATTAGG